MKTYAVGAVMPKGWPLSGPGTLGATGKRGIERSLWIERQVIVSAAPPNRPDRYVGEGVSVPIQGWNGKRTAESTPAGAAGHFAKLAEAVQVHVRTVERWIMAGRVPYRKHRCNVAAFFGVEESFIWPDALGKDQVMAASESEIAAVYPYRRAVPRDAWGRSGEPMARAPAAAPGHCPAMRRTCLAQASRKGSRTR